MASFEPYHLEGAKRASLVHLAGAIHERLAEADGVELVQMGHQLYRAVFCLDESDPGSAGAIRTWLTELISANAVERLEFLSDVPGLIPWNLLTDEHALDQAAEVTCQTADGSPNRFWGARFSMGAGRRVNALRQNPTQVKPAQLCAADLDLVQQLAADQQLLLDPLRNADALVNTITTLEGELNKRVPDVLSLLIRFEGGQLRFGADSFSILDLQKWIEEPKEGNPDPLVILMVCGAAAEQPAWRMLLGAASATLSGLVANEVLLSPAKAFAVGHALAQRFSQGKQSLGEILQALRCEQGAAALAFSAFCPPQIRVVEEEHGGDQTAETQAPGSETQVEMNPLPRSPYRPFAAFEAAERALFFGREDDILRGALLADQAEAVAVLMHGSPAVGKTSYLQAGLIPHLEEECVGYRILCDRSPLETPLAEKDYPALILRCTSDLAGQFADALFVFCAQPLVYATPAGTQVNVDLPKLLQQTVRGIVGITSTAIQEPAAADLTRPPPETADDEDNLGDELSARELWIALRDNKEMLAKVLDTITRSLPFELVIAVDQGEELLAQVRTPPQQERRQKAIEMLTCLSGGPARCKVLYVIRSQALGEFVNLFPQARMPTDWRNFYIRPLTKAQMVDALLWPTNREEIPYCQEIPYQKYGFAFEDGMAPQIVADAIEASASEQQSPLSIVQAVGALLYDKQVREKKQEVLRVDDIKNLGGVKQALDKFLEQTLEQLAITRQSRQALRALISKLYLAHPDGTLSCDVIRASELKTRWDPAAEPVEPIVKQAASEHGLFAVQELLVGGQPDYFVSLPQDSLARLGKKLDSQREQQAYARTRMIDVLWIMVPLMFLAAAVTFWATRNFLGGSVDRQDVRRELIKEIGEEMEAFIEKDRLKTFRAVQRPIYYGQMAQAGEALGAGNALRAREILLAQMAMFSELENKLPDLRGFEWRYLWRELNRERYLLEGHKAAVTSVAISPDSQRAASAGADGTTRIWNLLTGKLLAEIPGSRTPVHAVAFAPDSKKLATAGADKIVRLWDLSILKTDSIVISKEAKSLPGHEDVIHALAFGKDANTLASAGADKTVILWDLATGKEKHKWKEHAAAVLALALAPDGKTLVSAGDEAAFVVYDAQAGTKRLDGKTAYRTIAALAIADDGKLCTGGVETTLGADQGVIRFWNIADGLQAGGAIQHGDRILALAYAPGGKVLAATGTDGTIRLWNVEKRVQQQLIVGHLDAVRSLAFAKDNSAIVSGSDDQTAKVWDPSQSSGPDVIEAHKDWVQAVALSRKNSLLASGARDGSVKLWDPKTNKLVKELPTHQGAVSALAFSHHKEKDSTFLAVATRDDKNTGEIKIWQIDSDPKQGWTIKDLHTLKQHHKGVTCLEFHPAADKADLLISGSADQTVKVWDIKTGKEKASYQGHKDEVRSVAFSFDDRTFASAGKDGIVCFYDLDSKDVRKLTDLHAGAIESIGLFLIATRDDEHAEHYTGIVTGGTDRTMRLWKYNHNDRSPVGKATKFQEYHSHTQPLTSVTSHGKNGLFISSSWDGTIKLYDMISERFTLVGHQGPVRAIAIASDQSFLASAGNDGTIRIWRTLLERGAVKGEPK
jgi:WD40 repeat protein